jgi:hypothetical protein
LAGGRSPSTLPEELSRPIDPARLNCRTRIGRQPQGDSFRTVILIDLCGTIQAPLTAMK